MDVEGLTRADGDRAASRGQPVSQDVRRIGSGRPVVNRGRRAGRGGQRHLRWQTEVPTIRRVIAVASSVATSRSRPPHREHAKTSAANTRRIKSAQRQPREEGAADSSANAAEDTTASEPVRGTTSARHAARGASTP